MATGSIDELQIPFFYRRGQERFLLDQAPEPVTTRRFRRDSAASGRLVAYEWWTTEYFLEDF